MPETQAEQEDAQDSDDQETSQGRPRITKYPTVGPSNFIYFHSKHANTHQ
jgi:hypothetical protein